jgi:phospholipid-binding lipoprotein MlaA
VFRLILPLLLLLTGCATVPDRDPNDPWEGFNRPMYEFNDALDRHVAKPLAIGYQRGVPPAVRTAIGNFIANLDDLLTVGNDLLQLKGQQAASDFARFVVNSTLGVFGLFDVATPMGLNKNSEDFGQTLGYWGLPSGPYLVLPLLGPSSLRDSVGLATDWSLDPKSPPLTLPEEGMIFLGDALHTRAGLLHASRLLDQSGMDPYIFMRETYLQFRQNLVYDGNPPFQDDELDELLNLDLDE